MPPPPPTARLAFRELTLDDDAFILELLNEPAFLEFIGDKGVRNREDARISIREKHLSSYAQHGFGLWAVALGGDGTLIGICGLIRRDFLDAPDVGYALLARHAGRGYATEAVAATLAHARGPLGFTRIYALTALENPASIAVLRKFGFRDDRVVEIPGYPGPSRVWVAEAAAPGRAGDEGRATNVEGGG